MPIVRIEAQVTGVDEATQQVNELNKAMNNTPKMTKAQAEALGKFNKQVTRVAHTYRRDVCGRRVNFEAAR